MINQVVFMKLCILRTLHDTMLCLMRSSSRGTPHLVNVRKDTQAASLETYVQVAESSENIFVKSSFD
jgi:hypothetical protein